MSLVDLLSSRALNLLTVCRVCGRSYRVDWVRCDRGSSSVRFRVFSCRFVRVLRLVLAFSFGRSYGVNVLKGLVVVRVDLNRSAIGRW